MISSLKRFFFISVAIFAQVSSVSLIIITITDSSFAWYYLFPITFSIYHLARGLSTETLQK